LFSQLGQDEQCNGPESERKIVLAGSRTGRSPHCLLLAIFTLLLATTDDVRPAYLQAVRVAVLNAAYDLLTNEEEAIAP
jgi:hypothetical protein